MVYQPLALLLIILFSNYFNFQFYSKGDSSLTCTTNLWYCHATNIYFDLKNFHFDTTNNRCVLGRVQYNKIILLNIYLKDECLYHYKLHVAFVHADVAVLSRRCRACITYCFWGWWAPAFHRRPLLPELNISVRKANSPTW